MTDDLITLLRGIASAGLDLPVGPSTCIFITPEHRMCGAAADPKRLGLCTTHWNDLSERERQP
jgi:hypothetical protein